MQGNNDKHGFNINKNTALIHVYPVFSFSLIRRCPLSPVNSALVAEEFKADILQQQRQSRIINFAPTLVFLFLTIAMSILVEGFFTWNNLINILYQISSPLVLAAGLTFVIVLGSIDLSLEGIMGFSGSIVTLLVLNSKNTLDLGILGIFITIVIATLAGGVTGILHVKLRIPSFMVTFGMAGIMMGFGIMSYRGRPASVEDPMFEMIARGNFLQIPYLTWFALILFLLAFVIQEYTAFGRHVFAIGENETILRSTGINVDKIKVMVFTWSAFCASIAGIFGAIRLERGEVTIGSGYLFSTITAVAVGGTALWGGKGGVLQSLVGVLIVVIIQSSMILLGVDPNIQTAVQGVLIIIAVALTVVRGRKIIIK